MYKRTVMPGLFLVLLYSCQTNLSDSLHTAMNIRGIAGLTLPYATPVISKLARLHSLEVHVPASGTEEESKHDINKVLILNAQNPQHNKLTDAEIKEGWQLLFEGKSLIGWRNFNKKTIGKSWMVDDESIHLNGVADEKGNLRIEDGGDIITDKTFGDFELKYDWKISPCGNSGVMFNILEDKKYKWGWETGPEMQVLDNACHPDAKYPTHRAGDLYDMISCSEPAVKQAGEWNHARIVSRQGRVDFWLNDVNVVSFTMHDKSWEERIQKSKFRNMPDFGKFRSGHIALQDHDNEVWFRNLKIKTLQ